MRPIDQLLEEYGTSHLNATNKFIHWFCIPAIMFSLIALLFAIPFFGERNFFFNWGFVFLVFAWLYYLRLSIVMFFGFLVVGGLLLWGSTELYFALGADAGKLAIYALAVFVVAWIGQFIGHKIEGKKPSFLKDVQFLLIGPAWLMHFVFRKVGVKY